MWTLTEGYRAAVEGGRRISRASCLLMMCLVEHREFGVWSLGWQASGIQTVTVRINNMPPFHLDSSLPCR